MSIRLTLVLLITIHSISLWGQNRICGTVSGSENNRPLSYVNIGILNTEIGTISNPDGSFCLNIPGIYNERELIFSSLGYSRFSIAVKEIQGQGEIKIKLKEHIRNLDSIIIEAKKGPIKSKILGNGKSFFLAGQLHCDTGQAGSAMAIQIKKGVYKDLIHVNDVRLYIARNKFPEFKVRLKFLKANPEDGSPTETELFYEDIIAESDIKKGWLSFDLPDHCIINDTVFYLMFEWILDKDDRTFIDKQYSDYINEFPFKVKYDTILVDGAELVTPSISKVVAGTIFGTSNSAKDRQEQVTYYRSNSFGEWKRSTGILAAKIKFSNQSFIKSKNHIIPPCEDLECKIDNWFADFKSNQPAPGMQMSVWKNGEIIYSKSLGYSNVEKQNLVDQNTQFRIASVSKPMTSLGLMTLVESGKLNLDTPIDSYLPELQSNLNGITSRQLASHRAGIRDYHETSLDEIFVQKHYTNLTDALELFKNDSLVSEPGNTFNYSSYGYILLGAIMESVSNTDYLNYMKNNIWSELEMQNTTGDIKNEFQTNKSEFYFFNGEVASAYDLSYSYPSGGLISTSEDLLNFGVSFITDKKIINDELLNEVFTSQNIDISKQIGYGLGWYIKTDSKGREVWYHAGELPSSGSMLIVYPNDKLVFSLLCNGPLLIDEPDGFSMEYENLINLILN